MTVKVTDAATKAPVAGRLEYFTFRDNPELKDVKFAAQVMKSRTCWANLRR